ncbi:MAG: FtsX-like permease family protein [Gudongella sp.]|nr:FtsX-like permease family protein [Gudongella sp.]
MKKLDKRLLRSIENSKGQFISITIMVVVALTIYVSFSMVSDKLYNSIYHYYEITNFADIFVDSSRLPKSAVDDLLSIEGVKAAQGRIIFDVPLRVEDPKEKVNVRVISVSDEDEMINGLYTIAGQELEKGKKQAAVLQQFYIGRDMKQEDIIRPYIGGVEYELEVISEVGSPEYIYLMENEQTLIPDAKGFGVIYVPEDFAEAASGYRGSYNSIVIDVDKEYENKLSLVADDIEDSLRRYGVQSVVIRDDQLSHTLMMDEVRSLEVSSTAITVLFLMVAGIIISIMLSRIVKKDRIGIGVLKGLGYTNLQILSHYAKYSIAIGLVGSLIGIVLSIPVSISLTNLYIQYLNVPLFNTSIDPAYFLYGIILSVIFCLVAGLLGAKSVLKISPADAMRPETPKAGKRIFLERFSEFWKKLSFSWKMVLRNISRTKRRAFFLVLGIALTYAVSMMPMYMSTIWTHLFDFQYGEFQKMDYAIDFSKPMDIDSLFEVKKLADIDLIEPKVELPFELSNGWKKKSLSVIAVNSDTSMYDFTDLNGQEVFLPKRGIVLSQITADILDVDIGDTISIRSFLPQIDEKQIEVKAIVKQYLGANAYMDIELMYKIIEDKGVVTGALIKSDAQIVEDLKDVKNIGSVQSAQDMQDTLLEYMNTIIASMGIMMIFGGVLGFAIVYNITIVSISERIMEFSSLRILGFEKKQIFRLIWRENALMTIFGIILGIPLGYIMTLAIVTAVSTEMFVIPAIITPSIYIFSGVATILFVVIAQLATYRKITNLNFIDALKTRIS